MSEEKFLIYPDAQNNFSKEFRAMFLLKFTRELIKHSGTGDILELKNILEQEKKEAPKSSEKIKKIEQEIEKDFPISLEDISKKPIFQTQRIPVVVKRTAQQRVLRIPEPRLPLRFQYLRPTPTNIQIDLGKINALVMDPSVRNIECNGPDENISVSGAMGEKKTGIILSKEDIDEIINKFSTTAKIPVHYGVLRIVVGRLILSAIISDVVGSKFIIKKMMYSQGGFGNF